MIACRRTLVALVLLAASLASSAGAQGPPPEVRSAVQSIERMLRSGDDASLQSFIATRLAPAYRQQMTEPALLAHLRTLRDAAAGNLDDLGVERTSNGMRLVLGDAGQVGIDFALDDQFRVTRLELASVDSSSGARSATGATDGNASNADWSGLTWESLDERFTRWEATGFNGVVLAQRDGKNVLRKAYGFGDRARNVRTSLTTIFGIGSTPIDFTRTGILLLAQRGKLALGDTIGRFLPGVPADKRTMTLQQLMTGKSGLPDFHDVPGDWDADLAWIDRNTAVQRILSQPLLFAPGASEQHSHSAFGLLAAVIEIASGTTYPEFVRAEFLTPLGMTRTGFYGERGAFGVDEFAVGVGPSFVGLPNIPPNWGPTSWLVMGSGGMHSTLDDMATFYDALESGRILTGDGARRQGGEKVGVGGSNRGFFIFRVANGRGDSVLGLMNGEGRAPEVRGMMRAVERVVFGR